MSAPLEFRVSAEDAVSAGRAGSVRVRGKSFATPAFMPVGTAGTVKGATPRDLQEAGVDILLCNTYHLFLRPGSATVAALGGLGRFMGWDGAILTDSGGFQVYSLGELARIDSDGMTIKSHIDGTVCRLDAEKVVEIQRELDSDITMAFDQCVPYGASAAEAAAAVERTTRWARRCRDEHDRIGSTAALFGIVQGGMDPALREQSCREVTAIGFDGYAVGGLSVGEGKALMHATLAATVPHLPAGRPRYLMGVGPPDDIVDAVAAGIDMFDCVVATRNARNAALFTRHGVVKIRNARYRCDPDPVDAACGCPACRRFSRAYLRHLFSANEMLGPVLATLHNLRYFQDLMKEIRAALAAGRFQELRREVLRVYRPGA